MTNFTKHRFMLKPLQFDKITFDESRFHQEFMCVPIRQYCHDFGEKHIFNSKSGRCEICKIKYFKFRELMERL